MNWPFANDPTNPDATPDLDDWGWDTYWTASDWLTWHAAMKSRYGLTYANKTFLSWWNKQTLGANPLDARSFNPTFRQYAKDNGFFAGLYDNAPLAEPLGAATDLVTKASDGLDSAATALKWAIPAALVVVVAIWAGPSIIRGYKSIKAAATKQ
jgi:hypothetical protein